MFYLKIDFLKLYKKNYIYYKIMTANKISKSTIETKENIYDLKAFNNRIEDVLSGIGFSCKKIRYDEFVKEYYDETSIYEYKIQGASNYYNYPRGVVWLNESNKIFYDAANIAFMIDMLILPINYINFNNEFDINDNKLIKIPRRNGDIQDGWIPNNSALRISRSVGGIFIRIKFLDKKQEFELEKQVKLYKLLELNNIKNFSFNIPLLKKSNYNFNNYKFLSDELINQIIKTYNSNVKGFMSKFIENFNEYNIDYKEEGADEIKYNLSIKVIN